MTILFEKKFLVLVIFLLLTSCLSNKNSFLSVEDEKLQEEYYNKALNESSQNDNLIDEVILEIACKNMKIKMDINSVQQCIENLKSRRDLIIVKVKDDDLISDEYRELLYQKHYGVNDRRIYKEIEPYDISIRTEVQDYQNRYYGTNDNRVYKEVEPYEVQSERKVQVYQKNNEIFKGDFESYKKEYAGQNNLKIYNSNTNDDFSDLIQTIDKLLTIGITLGGVYLLGSSLGSVGISSTTSAATPVDPGVLCATGLAGLC